MRPCWSSTLTDGANRKVRKARNAGPIVKTACDAGDDRVSKHPVAWGNGTLRGQFATPPNFRFDSSQWWGILNALFALFSTKLPCLTTPKEILPCPPYHKSPACILSALNN